MKIVAQTKNVQQLLRISLFIHQRGTRLLFSIDIVRYAIINHSFKYV